MEMTIDDCMDKILLFISLVLYIPVCFILIYGALMFGF